MSARKEGQRHLGWSSSVSVCVSPPISRGNAGWKFKSSHPHIVRNMGDVYQQQHKSSEVPGEGAIESSRN